MSWYEDRFPPDDEEWIEIAASFRPVRGGAAAYFQQAQARLIRSLVIQIAELVSADAEAGADSDDLEAQLGTDRQHGKGD